MRSFKWGAPFETMKKCAPFDAQNGAPNILLAIY
jgi:hypothetical protein